MCSDFTADLISIALERVKDGYDGEPHSGGRYYSINPWRTTIIYDTVNHLLRAIGTTGVG